MFAPGAHSTATHLFALMSGWYARDQEKNMMVQHYFVAGVEVCRCVFLLLYPVPKTVERVAMAIKRGDTTFYKRDLEVWRAVCVLCRPVCH